MLNKVMLIGRLGADPEIKYSQGGSPIANLRVATDESYTDRNGQRQEKTEWHTVIAFQRTAEICQQYLHKGSLVYIEGKLQTRKWQDKQGQERYTTEIQCQRLQMLERRQEGAHTQQPAPQQAHEDPGWDECPF